MSGPGRPGGFDVDVMAEIQEIAARPGIGVAAAMRHLEGKFPGRAPLSRFTMRKYLELYRSHHDVGTDAWSILDATPEDAAVVLGGRLSAVERLGPVDARATAG